jgi:hypothetical protein
LGQEQEEAAAISLSTSEDNTEHLNCGDDDSSLVMKTHIGHEEKKDMVREVIVH